MNEQKVNFKSLKASCQNCSLIELCLPRGLNNSDLSTLDDIIQQRRLVHKNENIFSQGEKSGCIYAVRSGSVKTFTTAKNGEEQILGFHLPGEILGLDGMDNQIHSCSGVALDTATICELPIGDLNVLCVKIPGLQQQLLSLISNEITKDHTMLMLLARRNAEQKLATFLINLSGRFKARGYSADEFDLTMSRYDIGNYLGLADETVSRLISRFKDNKIIDANRKKISILDHDALCGVAEGEQSLN
ncbi:MAG: fumarate/nitrate reduction transcriptional regulator Fnr [Gammaproteobacteria bacterium]|nr:fumarate/nitrate reduction transcriptional regulator Fnr [Gammaproteobacteria bacterium]MBT8123578.1 fumarate/nitrate reduction transcriptional regulator Fnr [Gammaproteobacteria bacterium]NNC66667.1 fumarate/nitrate reduction transcriptional regulator Fnr [Gammaproteobacteria bacterium]